MSEVAPVVETPPAPAPAPDPKPAEKKLLDELKQAKAKAKELEGQLAEAKPYLEKFRSHDEAKALEAQREAEARAKQESEARARLEVDSKKERAILRSLLGLVPPGDDELAEFAVWKMSTDPSIIFDPETGTFAGIAEARERLAASPRFGVKPGEPLKKPAPGLPVMGQQPWAGGKKYTTIAELDAEGPEAVLAFQLKSPDEYAALRVAHNAALLKPRRQMMPTPLTPQR